MSKVTFKVGEAGEEMVMEYLRSHSCPVVDLRQRPEFQARDTDFAVFTPEKHWRTMEVKTDTIMHSTGNIMVELSMSRRTGVYDGWFYKCKADILCYVDDYSGDIYFLPWPELHAFTTERMEKEPSCVCSFLNPYDANCVGKGVLLNVKKHLLPNKLVLKVAHSEMIKKVSACENAGVRYEWGKESSKLVIPA